MKIFKKKKNKKVSLLFAALAIAAIIIAYLLLSYRPASYIPDGQSGDSNQVSTYLTHDLAPQFYNSLQKRQPFEMVIIQQGVNEAITRLQYPIASDSISVSNPAVNFSTNGLLLMCTAHIKGMKSFVTLQSLPSLNGSGLLNLNLNSVKIGVIPVTPLVRSTLEKIIRDMSPAGEEQSDDIASKITLSLLENKPFDPVFTLGSKKIRITKIAFENEKLTIGFAPVRP